MEYVEMICKFISFLIVLGIAFMGIYGLISEFIHGSFWKIGRISKNGNKFK